MTGWLGAHRIDLEVCGSTNDEAARLARAGAVHGTVVVARAQEAGRGRDGRVWVSPPGAGLYWSAVVRPPLPIGDVPPMTLAIGVGACDAVRALGVAGAAIKWPNDLYVGREKLGGILVEAQSQGARLDCVIVGIGINVAAAPIETGVSIADAGGTADVETLVAAIHSHVGTWIDRYVARGLADVIPAWHARMARGLVARATVNGKPVTGEITGLDTDGAVVLRDRDAVLHRVRSGDVAVVPSPE